MKNLKRNLESNLKASLPLSALLLAAIGCGSAPSSASQAMRATRTDAPRAGTLEVRSHTGSEAAFSANSHLILGSREAILVDTQFTRTEARKVAAMVRESGRELKTIFITHGHPDHYLGLEILVKEFPKAKVLATAKVIADIQATAPGKLAYWKPMYKDDLADGFILPQALEGDSLELEGEKLPVTELAPGESEASAVVYLPSLKAVVAGDAIYSDVHLWLAENRPEGWLANLESLRKLGSIETILAGHGPSGDSKLIEANERYIRDFVEPTAKPASKAGALEKVRSLYPSFLLAIIAELSVGARVDAREE